MSAQKVKEEILQAPDGGLVLKGIASVGIDNAVDFSDVYHYPHTSFPEGTPLELTEEMFEGALRQHKD